MPRQKKPEPDTRSSLKSRLGAMASVASKNSKWSPPREVLTRVRAHPTRFPGIDRAVGVGGWPIERICVVHGPSNHGKTELIHGIGSSFLGGANFYAFVDAEMTTPIEWLQLLMSNYVDHQGFRAMRPKCYEDVVDGVRALADEIIKAKEAGNLPPDITGMIAVDSVRKMVPKGLLDKMIKDGTGVDGAKGRAAQMKAALNSQWMDELVPLMAASGLNITLIAREYEKEKDPKDLQDPSKGFDYTVGGGKGLAFDASLTARVTRSWIKNGDDIIGERKKVVFTKTKVAGKTGKVSTGYFHTSNGVMFPKGYDKPRDVLELALEDGVVEKKAAWLHWNGQKFHGENRMLKALHEDSAMLDSLEGELREPD